MFVVWTMFLFLSSDVIAAGLVLGRPIMGAEPPRRGLAFREVVGVQGSIPRPSQQPQGP